MTKVILKKSDDRKKVYISIAVIVVVMLLVFGLWLFQTSTLLSVNSIYQVEQNMQETQKQLNQAFEYGEEFEKYVPALNMSFDEIKNSIINDVSQEVNKQKVIDAVAKEVLTEIESTNPAEEAATSDPTNELAPNTIIENE